MRVSTLVLVSLVGLSLGCSKSREPLATRSAPLRADPTVVERVADLNHSLPRYAASLDHLTSAGDALFFTQYETDTGTELWKTDGTAAGTTFVKDLVPGGESPGYFERTDFKGRLFFTTYDGHTLQLWSSDGSVAGTSSLFSATPLSPSAISELTVSGDTLFFAAATRESGVELWKTDGTSAGTRQVRDLNIGWAGSNPSHLTAGPGGIYFVADDGAGPSLWKSDGTAAGTVQLATVPVTELAVVGTRLFFSATDENGTELWRSDGTASGTHLLKDIAAGAASSSPSDLTAVGGTLFFSADDGVNGPSLWKSDGTNTGTVLVKAVRPGAPMGDPAFFRAVNGRLVFSACASPTGCELWGSDGSSAGTQLLVDANVGGSTRYSAAVLMDGQLYLTATYGIWATDGTPANTRKVYDIVGPGNLSAFHHKLYFVFGDDLYVSDGTSAGTRFLADRTFTSGSAPSEGWLDGDRLFVVADDGQSERRLFVDDGTDAGVTAISDPGSQVSASQELVPCAGLDFFVAMTNDTGWEVWRTDGTPEGTRLSVDFYPGPTPSGPNALTCYQGALYFSAYDSASGHFVRLDPASGAVSILADTPAPNDTPGNKGVLVFDGQMYFSSSTPGSEGLWRSDGTVEGTALVVPLGTAEMIGPPRYLVTMGGALYFVARESSGSALWRTDGTAVGTAKVGELRSTLFNPVPIQMAATRGELYVAMKRGTVGSGSELFRSDGTPEGTYRLATLSFSEETPSLTPLGDVLFFRAPNPATGNAALWRTDGTNAGTFPLRDLSFLGGTVPFNGQLLTLEPEGRLVFTAWTPELGSELWVSDGTPKGTRPALDLSPGPLPSMANPLARRGDWLYFAGDDHLIGDELWRIAVPFLADNAPPSLSCPADVTVEAAGPDGQTVSFPLPTASDTFPVSPEVAASPAPGSRFSLGSTPVEVTSEDWAGNETRCSFAVTVADTTPPTLACPADVLAEATDCGGAALALPAATVEDVVGVGEVSSSPPSGSFFTVGSVPVVVTARDLAGNASSCTFQVSVAAPPQCSDSADAGEEDGGSVPLDGGEVSPDAGIADAGVAEPGVADAGVADAGGKDGGVADAGSATPDAGSTGNGGTRTPSGGGSCSQAGTGLPAPLLLLLLVFTRRRRRGSAA